MYKIQVARVKLSNLISSLSRNAPLCITVVSVTRRTGEEFKRPDGSIFYEPSLGSMSIKTAVLCEVILPQTLLDMLPQWTLKIWTDCAR